ncbi:unnamed protein product, partial [Allacma fusca]
KKDYGVRIKHLKIVLAEKTSPVNLGVHKRCQYSVFFLRETAETDEAKYVFSTHYSQIYHLVYEGIVSAESKIRGPGHQRQREELENILQILEKIMLLLPDLLQCRWQLHSLSRLLGRLSHPHNSIR